MAALIPWQDAYDFQFEVALDRFVYLIRARFNHRAEVYALDLMTRNRVVIVRGLCLLRNVNLFDGLTHPDAPRGALVVVGEQPTKDNLLNGSAQLVYIGVLDSAL